MKKPNKSEIAAKLEAWVKNEKKRLRIEVTREEDLEPHVTRCQRAIASINTEADEAVRPFNDKKKQLEAEIISALESGIDRETGKVALLQVEVMGAVARVNVTEGNRVIGPEAFFNFTPAPNRTPKFWECVTIPIGKASQFLGSAIDRLATKPSKFEVKISQKD